MIGLREKEKREKLREKCPFLLNGLREKEKREKLGGKSPPLLIDLEERVATPLILHF